MATTDPIKKIGQVRARKLAAAKRSLGLVRDALTEHESVLGDGAVPADSFLVHAQKYDQTRLELVLLDSVLGGSTDEEAELAADLAPFVQLVASLAGGVPAGSGLARLAAIAFPDGQVPPPPAVQPQPPFPPEPAMQPTAWDPGWPPMSSDDM